ncbi:hypothetical protein OLOG_00225 [Ostreococcus lucimarinus virus OlV4]|nr:hypothetical protein OLOG_00225 [Ostreococcus lucimarinus virus OlV4]
MNLEQKSIYFVDDYLNNEEIAFVDDYFKHPVWGFGHCTDQSDERLFKGRWFVADLGHEKFFNEHLLKKLKKQLVVNGKSLRFMQTDKQF